MFRWVLPGVLCLMIWCIGNVLVPYLRRRAREAERRERQREYEAKYGPGPPFHPRP
jgi:hypothetical protein